MMGDDKGSMYKEMFGPSLRCSMIIFRWTCVLYPVQGIVVVSSPEGPRQVIHILPPQGPCPWSLSLLALDPASN